MKISKLCISILILLFFSCNTNNVRSLNQPLVIKVDTILIESTRGTQENGATSIIEFNVYFDKTDLSELNSIIIESPEGSKWSFDKEYIKGKFNHEEPKLYFDTLTSSIHKHHIPLGKYILIVNYENDLSQEYKFLVYGRGDINLVSGSIFTEEVSTSPKILNTPTNYNAYLDGDNLILNFESSDEIVTDGYIWLYNKNKDYLSVEGWFSDVKPVVNNGSNQYVFNIREIKDHVEYIELVLYSDTTTMNDKTIYWCRTGDFPITKE